MTNKIRGVLSNKRRALSKGWMAFLIFGTSSLIGGLIGGFIVASLQLNSILSGLGVVAGFIVVYPVSFLLYRYLSKRFVHQQIG